MQNLKPISDLLSKAVEDRNRLRAALENLVEKFDYQPDYAFDKAMAEARELLKEIK